MLAVANMGCASRYSQSYLQAIAPHAEIVQVCAQPPTVETNATVWAHNIRSRETKSDRDWDEFERFAEAADIIYRYDPNAPAESTSRLPWPYQHMSCRSVSSSKVPPLPTGMKEIPISREMREALVAALLVDERLRPAEQKVSVGVVGAKRYLGQLTTAGYGPRVPYSPEQVEEVEQMLHDAIRTGLPHVTNLDGARVSILDTTAGQVIGGVGAGAAIGTVPGGSLMVATMQATHRLPQQTREFSLGQAGGEMLSGGVQFILGTGGTVGGVGLSLTGGGSFVGVPTCVMGAALAANGAMTFLHGASTLVVTLCHWNELPTAEQAQPLAATAHNGGSSTSSPPSMPSVQSGGAAPKPTAAGAAEPIAKPVQPAKPVPAVAAPAKPAPIPEAPPPGTTYVHKSASGTTTSTRRRLAPGEKPPQETTTITTTEGGGTTTTVTRPRVEPAKLEPYSQGGGHHVPAKRAFEGTPRYDANKALAIPKNELERLNISHNKVVTPQQRRAYMDFAKKGQPLTWEVIAEIETEVLVKSGLEPGIASATVAKSIKALKDAGVAGPVRIPWGN